MSQKAREQAGFGIDGGTYGATYSKEQGGINEKTDHLYRTTA